MKRVRHGPVDSYHLQNKIDIFDGICFIGLDLETAHCFSIISLNK